MKLPELFEVLNRFNQLVDSSRTCIRMTLLFVTLSKDHLKYLYLYETINFNIPLVFIALYIPSCIDRSCATRVKHVFFMRIQKLTEFDLHSRILSVSESKVLFIYNSHLKFPL